MKRHTIFTTTILLAFAIGLGGYERGDGTPSPLISAAAAAPRIASVSPETPVHGPADQTLTVTGSGFRAGLSLDMTTPEGTTHNLSGSAIESARDSSFKVSITLATAGTYTLVVTNPDGGTSEAFEMRVAKR